MKLTSHKTNHPLRGLLSKDNPLAAMGDKSISHRALMFASMARGTSRISGLLESEDTHRTQRAMEAVGVDIKKEGQDYVVTSAGFLSFRQPQAPLDMGNSGTSARLLMGLLAGTGHPIKFFGDSSLSKRPMGRVIDPLSNMGVVFDNPDHKFLPLAFRGQPPLLPLDYTLPVASAQIKSAILLAGLSAIGQTTIWEKEISRDHTERMLAHFGVEVRETLRENLRGITIEGGVPVLDNITAKNINIPRDISSVAFLLVAASIIPDSDITIENVGLNPTRDGILETLLEMGADIKIEFDSFAKGSEPHGTVKVKYAPLRGVTTPPERAARMIDEYPILAMAAAVAHGTSLFQGLSELRVKESDRLNAIATGLAGAGLTVKTGEDWIEITGKGLHGAASKTSSSTISGGNMIHSNLDHRIAMSFYILGLIAEQPIVIDDASAIATSFPHFLPLINHLLEPKNK